MLDFERLFIHPNQTIGESVQIIDIGAVQIALVVDEHKRLLGTVTDGDVRRGLLNGKNLESPVESVMHREFRSLSYGCAKEEALELMRTVQLHQVPILNNEGQVTDLLILDELLQPAALPNRIVIMAGGEGRRLRPHTENCPKPMLPIAGRPMLEIILEKCATDGLTEVYIAVHYLKEQIMDYFQDGGRLGLNIHYLEEKHPMGTAGALSLLPPGEHYPLLVINGDVLTRVDLTRLLRFHEECGDFATVCVREYTSRVPYGVVQTEDQRVVSIHEKPVFTHHINAGLYVLNSEIPAQMSPREYCNMTQLLENCINRGEQVSAFPIHEYWKDIGLHDTHQQANLEWVEKM